MSTLKKLQIMERPIDEIPNIVILHRIPLGNLIEALHEIYNQGADFIDLGIVKDPKGKLDTLKVGYTMDYLSIEALEHFNANKKMSDDDINELTE